MSEIDAFPRAVLQHHYPETPCHHDFTTSGAGEYPAIDILVGGTPCQSFSVAGLRGGLADARGNLALEYLRLAERLQPRWVVWENVPGVLSSANGRDFGAFVGGLAELGYGWAYRVLDAQYFRLAQRRKRVFVVGCLGDWRCAAAVLFEPASLRWHHPPSRTAGERIAGTTSYGIDSDCFDRSGECADRGAGGRSGLGIQREQSSALRSKRPNAVAMALNAHGGSGRLDGESETFITHSLRADGFDASEDGTGRGTPLVFDTTQITSPVYRSNNQPNDPCHTLAKGAHAPAIAFTVSEQANGFAWERDVHATLAAHPQSETSGRQQGIRIGSAVRRLTPRECERLQGFPDDYTLIPYCGKPAADGPRYRALGNSMAVPCMAWIGRRIELAQRQDIAA